MICIISGLLDDLIFAFTHAMKDYMFVATWALLVQLIMARSPVVKHHELARCLSSAGGFPQKPALSSSSSFFATADLPISAWTHFFLQFCGISVGNVGELERTWMIETGLTNSGTRMKHVMKVDEHRLMSKHLWADGYVQPIVICNCSTLKQLLLTVRCQRLCFRLAEGSPGPNWEVEKRSRFNLCSDGLKFCRPALISGAFPGKRACLNCRSCGFSAIPCEEARMFDVFYVKQMSTQYTMNILELKCSLLQG